jgi:hypothetical protein
VTARKQPVEEFDGLLIGAGRRRTASRGLFHEKFDYHASLREEYKQAA